MRHWTASHDHKAWFLQSRTRILLVEDHPELGPSIRQALTREGFEVILAVTLQEALDCLIQGPRPHLIVLDLSLPDADGLEAIRTLRALPLTDPPPILILTVYRDVDLRVHALEMGADDFMVKPFAIKELIARLRALSRRGRADHRGSVAFGPLIMDPRDRTVRLEEKVVSLTPGEFAILRRLAMAGGGPVSGSDLGEPRAGDPISLSEGAVRVLIHRLRRKLSRVFGDQVLIRWNRLEGYRLEVRR